MAGIQDIFDTEESEAEFNALPAETKLTVFEALAAEDKDFQALPAASQTQTKNFILGTAPETGTEKALTFAEDIAADIPEIAGGAIGGALAAAKSTPIAAGAAALGAGAGEAFRQIGEQIESGTGFDVPFVSGEDAPKTSEEAAMRIVKAGLTGAVGEVGGRFIANIGGRILGKLAPKLEEGAKEAQQLLQKEGGTLTLAQATTADIIDTAQNAAEASLIGAGGLRAAKQKGKEIVTNTVNKFVDDIGTKSKEAIGASLQEAIDDKSNLFSRLGEGLYRNLDKLTQPEIVTTDVIKKVASNIVDENGIPFEKLVTTIEESLGKGGVDLKSLKQFALKVKTQTEKGIKSTPLRNLVRNVLNKPDKVAFADAHILRSDLLAVVRQSNDVLADKTVGASKRMGSLVDAAMTDASKELSGEAFEAFRKADRFWKTSKTKVNEAIVKRIAKTANTDTITRLILTPKSSAQIKRVKNLVGNKRWQEVQGQFLRDLTSNPSNLDDGVLKFSKLDKAFERFGDETIAVTLTPAQNQAFRNLIQTGKLIEKGQPTSTGRVFIALQQAGAALAAMTFDFTGTAATILIGPAAIAKVFSNPTVVNFIVKGMKLGRKTQNLSTFAARFSTLLAREGIEHDIVGKQEP